MEADAEHAGDTGLAGVGEDAGPVEGFGGFGEQVGDVADAVEPFPAVLCAVEAQDDQQVFIGITRNNTGRKLLVNASGRALIKTGQSCGVAVSMKIRFPPGANRP